MSRNLSCFAISVVASQFTLYTVASASLFPVYLPELTSIAVNASALSIVINPPHLSQIFLFSLFLICSSISSFSVKS